MRGLTAIPWVFSLLLLVYSAASQRSQLSECPNKPRDLQNRFCSGTRTEFPEWCNCNGDMDISLTEPGILTRLGETSLIYFFDNLPGVAVKCFDNRVCLCPKKNEVKCRQCNPSKVNQIMCLSVTDNYLYATENGGPSCNISRLCLDDCTGETCNGMLPPPIGPRVTAAASGVPPTEPRDTGGGVEPLVLGSAGAGAFVLILLLLTALIFFCCRNKDASKKKESPYDAVYSTIDDGTLRNGNVMKQPHVFPNQLYDARIEGQQPPIPPSRPGVPAHYKSLPSLLAGDYFSTGMSDQDQPQQLPHHRPVWKNGPTLHRYPSSDALTPRYLSYGQEQTGAPGAPYMYLKKKQKQYYQSLSPTVEVRPNGMEDFMRLATEGRPGYRSPTSGNNAWLPESVHPLSGDPRSLPADGSPRGYDESRQPATYGFEKKAQKPRSSSERSGSKPVPAKRGMYRSSAKADSGVNVASSDSEDESYQEGGSEACPHYFKMSQSERGSTIGSEEASGDQSERNTLEDANDGVEQQPAKSNPRKKPKPRSRRARRRPTTEVTCAMTANPLATSSHDESEYTDEDIGEGLQQMCESDSGYAALQR